MLCFEARSLSSRPLYSKVPDLLKGYVELMYDANNHPTFRVVESLVYKSHFYQPDAQSMMVSEIRADSRPFALSTPRLESSQSCHFHLPFNRESIDQLFRTKAVPQPIERIRYALGDFRGPQDRFEAFFTSDPPPPYAPYTRVGVRWRYFGHVCILIETQGRSVPIDPVLSYRYESDISWYAYQDRPDQVDFVLITHNHQDHILLETLLQLRHKIGQIVVPRSSGGSLQDPSVKLLLERVGFRNVIELGELETCRTGGFELTGIPFFGEHADLDVRSKLAYLIRTANQTLMFAADSCNLEPHLYRRVSSCIGPVDALFIGMECDGAPLSGLYGPLTLKTVDRAVDQARRLSGCNYDQAFALVDALRCREVYVHAMRREPWLRYFTSVKYTEQSRPIVDSNRLIEECRRCSKTSEGLFGEKEIPVE